MSDTTFEDRLGKLIDEHSRAAVRPVDRYAIAEAAIAEGRRRPRASEARRMRRGWPLLGLAAALLLPAALVVIAQRPTPFRPSGTWDALLVRPESDEAGSHTGVVQVLVVGSDGVERSIRRVDTAALEPPVAQDGKAFTGAALASLDGWLALELSSWSREPATAPGVGTPRTTVRRLTWWALLDLRDDGPIMVVPFGAHDANALASAGWAPGGRFATQCPPDGQAPCGFERVPDLSVQFIDATRGREVVVAAGMALPQLPGQDRITWAADGSGLLTVGDRLSMDEIRRIRDERERSGTVDLEQRMRGDPGIDPGDASDAPAPAPLPRVLGVPALAAGPGPRWVVEGGTWLEPDTAVVHRPDGSTTGWATDLPEGTLLREASLAADGRSAWFLLAEATHSPRWVALARAAKPGVTELLANATSIARPSAGDGSIAGIAPDDSIVALSVVQEWTARGAKVALIPTDGVSARTIHAGRFAGFVPSGLLDGRLGAPAP